jgi:glycerol-3-phosphate O-acyltransferase / dihydroxyacetone phosphate acyltransferase
MRRLADRLVRWIARAATAGWFRAVDVTGLERIPRSGPVLLVASHHGGFVDPALLIAVIPRPVRFLAMGTLFKNRVLKALLTFGGALPVYRSQDSPEAAGREGNVHTFAACFDTLREGGAIGIFPEGEASDEPRLLPIRTGAARIAIGAHARGTMGLRIVPVGLIYERKQRARSRAYVRVGEPIAMDEDLATNPAVPPDESDRALVAALTERIEEHLADAAVDYESAEQRSELRLAADVALRWEQGDPRGRPPMGEVERLADRLSEAPADAEERVRVAAQHYRDGLAVVGVPDAVVAPGAEEALAQRGRFAWLLTLAVAPFALVGLVANALPMIAVSAAGRKPAPPVRHATIKFLTAFVVFPLTWAALYWWVFADARYGWLLTLVVGPICGLAAAWCVGRVIRARRARLGLERLAAATGLADDLRARRARVVEAVKAATASTAEEDRSRPDGAGSLDVRP